MSVIASPSPLDLVELDSLDPNQLIVCPFDPTHRFQRKKLQYHLLKEHPNYQPEVYMTCPFNASHRVSKQEFNYHLVHCDSRGSVEADLIKRSDPHRIKGDTSVPVASWEPPSLHETWDEEDPETAQGFVLDYNMTSRSSKNDRKSPVVISMKPRKEQEPPPVVRMPTNPSIAKSLSPRKFLGRGRGRAYIASTTPAVSQPGLSRPREPETPQGAQPVHHMAGRHQPLSVGVVGQPSGGLCHTVPNYVGLGRGVKAVKQKNPASVQSPPQTTQHTVAAASMLLSPDKSDTGSFASTESEDDERRSVQNKVRKLRKMLRQINKIEEKEQSGSPLQDEQIAKLQRKGDVLASLAEAEEQLRKLQL